MSGPRLVFTALPSGVRRLSKIVSRSIDEDCRAVEGSANTRLRFREGTPSSFLALSLDLSGRGRHVGCRASTLSAVTGEDHVMFEPAFVCNYCSSGGSVDLACCVRDRVPSFFDVVPCESGSGPLTIEIGGPSLRGSLCRRCSMGVHFGKLGGRRCIKFFTANGFCRGLINAHAACGSRANNCACVDSGVNNNNG